MKRLLRLSYNVATVLSVILCVPAAALWVASHGRTFRAERSWVWSGIDPSAPPLTVFPVKTSCHMRRISVVASNGSLSVLESVATCISPIDRADPRFENTSYAGRERLAMRLQAGGWELAVSDAPLRSGLGATGVTWNLPGMPVPEP